MEFWWLVEANRPRRMYGPREDMSEDEARELYRRSQGDSIH